MGFQGYKLRHKMAIYQINRDDPESSIPVIRNLDMNVFIQSDSSRFYRFEEMERQIAWALKRFTERPIDEIIPFNELEPTLENIGNVFFNLIKESLAVIEAPADRLEISENLVKTFVVTESYNKRSLSSDGTKINITDLFMSDYISVSIASLISDLRIEDAAGRSNFSDSESLNISEDTDSIEYPTNNGANFRMDDDDVEKDFTRNKGLNHNVHMNTSKDRSIKAQKRKRYIYLVVSFSLLIIVGILFTLNLYEKGFYPVGEDIYGHLFKSDLLYNSMKNRDYYPLYTNLWYNGIQPFRYWAPLPYYILALMQFITGGDVLLSYLLFTTFSVIVGGIGWLIWGIYSDRLLLCTFLSLMWFFMPDNMRVFFMEGNLPRMVIAILLPYLFFFVWRFVEHYRRNASIPIVLIMSATILCHIMIAAMVGIATFIFLLIYSISKKRAKESFYVICLMLVAFIFCGIWLYPALKGGLVSMDATYAAEMIRIVNTPASISLNPFLRSQGFHEKFYFGFSIFAVSVFGLIFSNNKTRSGFITTILVFFGTLPIMAPILDKLPLNQLFWMPRFTPIIYTVFMLSLIEWKNLKRYVIIIFALIIVLDCIPSLHFYKYRSLLPETFSYTINESKQIANQRMSLMDLSSYSSYPSFGISTEEPKMPYTFGWAWQGAATAYNIMMKNTALEKGYYTYLFDRCLELGDDTVLIQKRQIRLAKQTPDSLIKGAAASNYYLVKETNDIYIFKCDTPNSFGTITDYKGLAIGKSANLIALEYPIFEESREYDITKYSLEELKEYDAIYLSWFTYKDKIQAEELITKAAHAGVKIIIDMNRIPSDPVTNRMSFLGVNAQPVSFTGSFPEMIYKGNIYEPLPFKKEYEEWNTVYLENLDETVAYTWIEGKPLPFAGSKKHKNIILLGYNILFHGMEAKDKAIMGFISDMAGFKQNVVPEREIVPLDFCFEKDGISIESSNDGVNTTLSFQDIFRSNEKIGNQTNLLVVQKGITKIKFTYPFLKEGALLSIIGIIITIFILKGIYKTGGKVNEKKAD